MIGTLPGADRSLWLARYAEVTGPLNAKGFLIACDGRPVPLSVQGYDLSVEEHPRYTCHFQASLPEGGVLTIRDTNYTSSEGTSRLAVRARDGASIQGEDLSPDVEEIPNLASPGRLQMNNLFCATDLAYVLVPMIGIPREHLPALFSRFPPSRPSQDSGLTLENLPLPKLQRVPILGRSRRRAVPARPGSEITHEGL